MYRFKITFELSQKQIKQYVKKYVNYLDLILTILFSIIGFILLAVSGVSFLLNIEKINWKATLVVGIVVYVLIIIIRIIRINHFIKKPPFAIGRYVTVEYSDGFLHVNCSGKMKSYPKGHLNRKITIDGDYILTRKKDMVVLPYRVLTKLIVEDLEDYIKDGKRNISD